MFFIAMISVLIVCFFVSVFAPVVVPYVAVAVTSGLAADVEVDTALCDHVRTIRVFMLMPKRS